MVIDKGSPLFEAMDGMHNVFINSIGETALKKGEPYPDKTVLVVDLHEFTVSEGSYLEGPRKATAIMLKDCKQGVPRWRCQAKGRQIMTGLLIQAEHHPLRDAC
jgi:Cytochrome P460